MLLWIVSTALLAVRTSASWSVNKNKVMMSGSEIFNNMFSESAAVGTSLGVEECHHQFKWDRWNCPKSSVSIFNENSFPTAIKEASFLSSIMSAGVMYTLILNCSMGEFKGCTCDDTKLGSSGGPNWKWGGCSDNIAFGERVSKQYIDQLETGKDARAIVTLHNNEAGRRAVKKTLNLSCKCHGVSGSCSVQTCWKELSDFRDIGDYLKRKYFKSVMVDAQNGQLRKGNSAQRRDERDILEISKYDLVYLETSPDFCKNNTAYGTTGTVGRECSRPSQKTKDNRWERKSCKRLCNSCGMKVKSVFIEQVSTCNCKFHWCCEVKCEECRQVVEKHTCVPR